MTIKNPALRQHVTRVGFDLTLGKTHIAALVYIDTLATASKSSKGSNYIDTRGLPDRMWSLFVTAAQGLKSRGLVWHKYPERKTPFHRVWGLTPAGQHVKGLLVEAGIWEEYASALPAPKKLTGVA